MQETKTRETMERENYNSEIKSKEGLRRYKAKLKKLYKQIDELASTHSQDPDWTYMTMIWLEEKADRILNKIDNYEYLHGN